MSYSRALLIASTGLLAGAPALADRAGATPPAALSSTATNDSNCDAGPESRRRSIVCTTAFAGARVESAEARAALDRRPVRGLSVAYTPRFLPGFAVTMDRAGAVWSGFVSGLGRTLASGRNCFTTACGRTAGAFVDGSAGLPQPPSLPGEGYDGLPGTDAAIPAAPTYADGAPAGGSPTTPIAGSSAAWLPAGVPELGGVGLEYGWAAGEGEAALNLRLRVAHDVYRWREDAEPRARAEGARGNGASLSLRRAAFELQVAGHRVRFDPLAASPADPGVDGMVRRELQLKWHGADAEVSAVLSDSSARIGGSGETVRDRAAWLRVGYALR
jgi:hypothetical protein